MQDYDQNFKNYIETLTPEIKQAIYSIDYPKKIQEVAKNNKLLIDQMAKLEAETTLVMAGVEPLDKFIKNLIDNVGLSSIQAATVAHDVNESIFKEIRESLKNMNDKIAEEDVLVSEQPEISSENPTQEQTISAIENPENIKVNEPSVSLSSLKSNGSAPEIHETIDKGIEIKVNNLPEIAPEAMLPMVSASSPKPVETYHQNISPVNNIVESKLTSQVVIPKQTIVIEEKDKLPERKISSVDAYREPIL